MQTADHTVELQSEEFLLLKKNTCQKATASQTPANDVSMDVALMAVSAKRICAFVRRNRIFMPNQVFVVGNYYGTFSQSQEQNPVQCRGTKLLPQNMQ